MEKSWNCVFLISVGTLYTCTLYLNPSNNEMCYKGSAMYVISTKNLKSYLKFSNHRLVSILERYAGT